MTRPDRLVLVVGTGTEIGKTWVSSEVLRRLVERGRSVAARKPAQSFEAGSTEPKDSEVLGAATGEEPDVVSPTSRSYEVAMAPPMAAEVLGRPVPSIEDLLGELAWPDQVDVGVVETAGGVRSPIASDGDSVSVARFLRPDLVVLVADAGLGTIHSVRACIDALDGFHTIVVLNRFDDSDALHVANLAWLRDRDLIDVEHDLSVVADAVEGSRVPRSR